MVHNSCAPAPPNGNGGGGAFRDVQGNGGEGHHIISRSVLEEFGLDERDAPAISMSPEDHRQTGSWGRSREAQKYRAEEADLLRQGKYRAAFEKGVKNIRSKFGNRYDAEIRKARKHFKKNKLKEKECKR